jgi:hypothetical protein
MNISGLIKELKAEKDLVQRHLAGIDAALTAFAGAYGKPRKRRKMSAAARKKIGDAQRKRWAKMKSKAKGGSVLGRARRR